MKNLFSQKLWIAIFIFYFFSSISFASPIYCSSLPQQDTGARSQINPKDPLSIMNGDPAIFPLTMAILQDALIVKEMRTRFLEEFQSRSWNNSENAEARARIGAMVNSVSSFIGNKIAPAERVSDQNKRPHKTFWEPLRIANVAIRSGSSRIILFRDKEFLPTIAYYDGSEPHQSKVEPEDNESQPAIFVKTIEGEREEIFVNLQQVYALSVSTEKATNVFTNIQRLLSPNENNNSSVRPNKRHLTVAQNFAISQGFVPISQIQTGTVADLYMQLYRSIGRQIIYLPQGYSTPNEYTHLEVGTIARGQLSIFETDGKQRIRIGWEIRDPATRVFKELLSVSLDGINLSQDGLMRGEEEALIYVSETTSLEQNALSNGIPIVEIRDNPDLAQELLTSIAREITGRDLLINKKKQKLTPGARILFFEKDHWDPKTLAMGAGEVIGVNASLFGWFGPNEITIRRSNPDGSTYEETISTKDIPFFVLLGN